MEEFQQFYILINHLSFKNNPSHIRVSLKDKGGKIIKEIKENALFMDKNFRDLSGLYIGLKEAKKFGAKRILILTDNFFLRTIIKNRQRESYINYYGFYNDINRMINNFKEVRVEVVA